MNYKKISDAKKRKAEYMKKWRKLNPDKIKAHRLKRKPKQDIYYKKWYAKNGRKRTPYDYQKRRIWILKNREKINAMAKVRYAVFTGRLIRPNKCSGCGKKGKVGGHHQNYQEPLKVIWLCHSCHLKIHGRG